MNQDQARRMAEEALSVGELTLIASQVTLARKEDGTDPLFLHAYAKAAIASALVKLTQQEPLAWLVCSVNADGSLSLEHAAAWEHAAHEHINDAITEHDIEGASSWVVRPAFICPTPIQQEDRKPLTETQIAMMAHENYWHNATTTMSAYRDGVRDAEAAHNIKEKQ